jgi:hypothetical protein
MQKAWDDACSAYPDCSTCEWPEYEPPECEGQTQDAAKAALDAGTCDADIQTLIDAACAADGGS